MAKNNQEEVTCTFEFTPGAIDRITQAFADLYYGILDGIYEGPLLQDKEEADDKTA